jgi:hypothetical protein
MMAALALALPATAEARHPATLAPPGNSAVTQYLETVPTDSGSRPSSSSGPSGGVLTPVQQHKLDSMGPDGRLLATAANSTAPVPVRASAPARPAHHGRKRSGPVAGSSRGSHHALAGPKGGGDGTNSGGGSGIASILSAAVDHGSGGGLGYTLPALMLAAFLMVAVQSVLRRRRGRAR